jgi:hypothetical protein
MRVSITLALGTAAVLGKRDQHWPEPEHAWLRQRIQPGLRLSSGLAPQWLGIPRVHVLLMAMEAGAELLEDTDEEFRRETALL